MAKRPLTIPGPGDDEGLMLRTGRGETEAFEELVRRHQRRVFNLVYRSVGNAADAEDLVQDVFLRVYRAADRYQPTARFTTWLYRVTTNAVINWLKRHERQPVEWSRVAREEGADPGERLRTDEDEAGGIAGLTQAELHGRVRQAIQALPDKQRLAMILFRFDGLSYQDVAEALSCSVMAVKSLLSRARENLRRDLAPYVEGESCSAAEL